MAAGNMTRSVPGAGRRPIVARWATETKQAFKTTEFWAYIAVMIGVLIAGAAIKGAGTDEFRGDQVWLYATILTVGYMISRGLAKAGSSAPFGQDTPSGRHDGTEDDDRTRSDRFEPAARS
jgi:hypothetical protein